MKLGIEGRTALISGASRGIGAAIARALAGDGAKVAVGYRTGATEARGVVDAIEADGHVARPVHFDVTDPITVRAAVDDVTTAWGPIEILVSCGGPFPSPGPFATLSDENWDAALRNQLEGPGNLIRAALPSMVSTGWGRIVVISTVHALTGNRGVVAHTAAKSGLHGLTRSLAKELGQNGVLVNAVLPGLTLTEAALEKFSPEHIEKSSGSIPSGHASTPDDVAALVAFLCSSANGNVTGELIRCAGGL